MGRSKLLLHRIVQSSKQLHFIIIAFSIDLIIKMPKKSNVRANTMPKNPKNDHNQQENSKSSPTPREISDPANKPQQDNLRTSISIQVGVVNNILDDAFKTSDESIIEKIVELTSNRRDILARIIAKNKETVEQLLRESIMKDGDVVSKESRRGVVKKVGIPLKSSKSELEREDQEIVKQVLKESTVNDKSPLCELKAKKRRGRKVPRRKVAKKLSTAVNCSKSELDREDQAIVKQVLKESTVNDKDPFGKTNAKKEVRKAPKRRDATKLLTPVKCSKSELEIEDQQIVKQVLRESTVNNEDRLGKTSAKKVGRGRPRKDSKISLAKLPQKKEMTVWLERNNYQFFLV